MNRRDFIKTAGVMTLGLMLDGNLTEAKPKMKISAVKLYDGGYMMKSFACGGGLPEGAIKEEKLRSICGYEHFGDEPPAVCPRCRQPASAFRKA